MRSRSRASATAGAALLLTAAAVLAPGEARANGAFPSSGQVLIDPTEPGRLWVSTSYGYARRDDAGGDAFYLVCEAGLGYAGGFHPHAAITPTGALFMGVSDGMAVGRAPFCSFTRPVELEGDYVVDVSVDPEGRAIALVQPPNGAQAQVWRSEDDLATWSQVGVDLPTKINVLTLDAAPNDPSTVYVSATTVGMTPVGEVLVTRDAGLSWTAYLVPESDAQTAPFIASVDAAHDGRLFVRLNSAPGRLYQSDDHGQTWDKVLETTGFLNAFRLSADGGTAYFGGTIDGLSRLDVATRAIEPLSDVGARCITLDGDAIYVCADESVAGFSAGLSTDGGHTFAPVFKQACVLGLGACGAGEPVRQACDPEWPAIAQQLAQTGTCSEGGGGAGGAAATGGAGATGAGASGAGGGPTGGAGGAGGSDGCDCSVGPASSKGEAPSLTGLAALALVVRSRRRQHKT